MGEGVGSRLLINQRKSWMALGGGEKCSLLLKELIGKTGWEVNQKE